MRSFVKDVTLITTGIAENSFAPVNLIPLGNSVFDLSSVENGVVSIFDMQGKLLQSLEKTDSNLLIDLSNNSEGIYLITLTNSTTRISKKIMVTK